MWRRRPRPPKETLTISLHFVSRKRHIDSKFRPSSPHVSFAKIKRHPGVPGCIVDSGYFGHITWCRIWVLLFNQYYEYCISYVTFYFVQWTQMTTVTVLSSPTTCRLWSIEVKNVGICPQGTYLTDFLSLPTYKPATVYMSPYSHSLKRSRMLSDKLFSLQLSNACSTIFKWDILTIASYSRHFDPLIYIFRLECIFLPQTLMA